MVKRLFIPFLFIFFISNYVVSAETGFQPSPLCCNCHEQKYMEWKNSAMMLGMNDIIFSKFYESVPGELKEECLMCHSPAAFLNKDMDFKMLSSKENIQCDFCHTAKNIIKKEKFNYYEFDPGFMKRGNLKDPEANLHVGVFSPLHTRSEFCSVCHEYRFKGTIPMDTTYSEWEKSGLGNNGKHCQDCHMRPYTFKYDGESQNYYRHTFDGPMKVAFGMDEENKTAEIISDALDVNGEIVRMKGKSEITVNIINSGAGHAVPASSHGLRRLVAEIEAYDEKGTVVLKDIKRMGLYLSNDSGEEEIFFWKASKITSDSRILSGDKRTFIFTTDSAVKGVRVKLYENLIPEQTALKLKIQHYSVILKEVDLK